MPDSILSAPYFHDEKAAYDLVEERIWPRGPICLHCGGVEKSRKMQGKSTHIGVYKCYDCRQPFTVKIGTIFEAGHIPMRVWLQAIFLVASSTKGVSSNKIHRMLRISLKSAWFMISIAMLRNSTSGTTIARHWVWKIANGPTSSCVA